MPKRMRSGLTCIADAEPLPPLPVNGLNRRQAQRKPLKGLAEIDSSTQLLDAPDTLSASLDYDADDDVALSTINDAVNQDSEIRALPDGEHLLGKKRGRKAAAENVGQTNGIVEKARKMTMKSEGGEELRGDPEAEGEVTADPEEVKEALARPPAVNSDYLPLPWKGRLGYACLCTYLRYSNPAIFCSRTTRIASIIEHRHPLKDPLQPEHAIKNRPDKEQPADIRRGQQFVEKLALANVRDMAKLIRWNDKYGIKFLRLSSEAFPFASHEEYGYRLTPFASKALAEVGKLAAELGHRLTVHPGQFTQLGSPRDSVIKSSIRDLEYHDEMLSLLKLPEQQDRDAVMILHMGGVFGDKAATLDRFRENYKKLSASIKKRLVLENDDMSWSVHDLLTICKELDIPLVLDYHHNNIIFDTSKCREGTKDIMNWYDEIRETWRRKGITQKMHYSEPTPAAVTKKQRRKHSPRVATLPPCPPDMDLMIEAKDKEQAVFELMRNFKLPGWDLFNNVTPNVREDDNKSILAERVKLEKKRAATKKGRDKMNEEPEEDEEYDTSLPDLIAVEEVGMGGPENRVYWPPGMEDWLRPAKRVIKKKEDDEVDEKKMTPVQKVAAKKKAKAEAAAAANGIAAITNESIDAPRNDVDAPPAKRAKAASATIGGRKKAPKANANPAPTTSDDKAEEALDVDAAEAEVKLPRMQAKKAGISASRRTSRAKARNVNYVED